MKAIILTGAVLFSSSALAEGRSILQSDKFNAKIKSLESYKVTYHSGRKAIAPKQQKKDGSGLELKLVPAQKKS